MRKWAIFSLLLVSASAMGQSALPAHQAPFQRRAVEAPGATLPAAKQVQEVTPIPPTKAYGLADPPLISLPRIEEQKYLSEDGKAAGVGERKIRAGVVRPLALLLSAGEWSELNDTLVWRIDIVSADAKALRLHLKGLILPKGGELFAYNPRSDSDAYHFEFSPSGEQREWWTGITDGEMIRLEVRVPSPDKTGTSLQIQDVAHIYRAMRQTANEASGCNLDAKCYPEWLSAGDSVAQLRWSDASFFYLCSGVLVNNLANDFSPLVLTAYHCISNDFDAKNIQFSWLYRTTACGAGSTFSTASSRGNLIGVAPGSDMTLLSVAGTLTSEARYAGWNLQGISLGTDITGIHHPQGSYQRISFGKTTDSQASGPINVQWTSGITEPGSSGSPIFNANRQVLGTLTGGSSSCGNPTGGDFYGSLASAYPTFANVLENGLPNDTQEPNDTAGTSRLLTVANQTLTALVLKYHDEDWYQITVPAKKMLVLGMRDVEDYHDWRGELYRVSDNTLVHTFVIHSTHDVLNESELDEVYLLRVYAWRGVRTHYSLELNYSAAAPPTGVSASPHANSYHEFTAHVFFQANGWPATVVHEWSHNADFSQAQFSPPKTYQYASSTSGSAMYLVENVAPDTTYYVRAHVATAGGNVTSAVTTVKIPSLPVPQWYIPQNNATNITLSPEILWDYQAPAYDLYLGTNPDPPLVASSTKGINFGGIAPSLLPNTKYYWRVTSRYLDFSAPSPIQTFTTGVAAKAFVPSPVDFGTVFYKAVAPTYRSVAIRNTGTVPLWVTNIRATSAFQIWNAPCSDLYPDETCNVLLRFNPGAEGESTGFMRFDDPANGMTHEVPLVGRVGDIILSLSRPSRPARSASGQTQTYELTLTPSDGLNGEVFFSCSGVVPGLTCFVSPTTTRFSGGPLAATVTVTVTSRSQRLRMKPIRSFLRINATIQGLTKSIDLPVQIER